VREGTAVRSGPQVSVTVEIASYRQNVQKLVGLLRSAGEVGAGSQGVGVLRAQDALAGRREQLDRTLAGQRDRTSNERFVTAADYQSNGSGPV
jgi:hypothetical protein